MPTPGGLSNPSLGRDDPGRSGNDPTGPAPKSFGYFGFADHLDTSVRGRPDDTLVMRVRSSAPDFWRGQTFDTWDGRSWTLSDARTAVVSNGSPLQLLQPARRASGHGRRADPDVLARGLGPQPDLRRKPAHPGLHPAVGRVRDHRRRDPDGRRAGARGGLHRRQPPAADHRNTPSRRRRRRTDHATGARAALHAAAADPRARAQPRRRADPGAGHDVRQGARDRGVDGRHTPSTRSTSRPCRRARTPSSGSCSSTRSGSASRSHRAWS